MIHALSTDVRRSAFWRFANGTIFNYKQRTFKKTSPFTAEYLDKLHGLTIEYFNPFQTFTYVGPRTREYPGTVVDEDAMRVILLDEPLRQVEYNVARIEYLDKLRVDVELENSYAARPNFSGPPAAQNSIRVSRFALVFDALMLPCRTVFNAYRAGVPASLRSLRVYPGWFKDAWRIARWDFWNGPTPKPFIHVPVKPMTITTFKKYDWDPARGRYIERGNP